MIIISDIIGLLGVVIMLVAYFLLSLRKISAEAMSYPILNALGSLMVMFSLFYAWNLSAFVMELCWFLISLYGMLCIWRIKRKKA